MTIEEVEKKNEESEIKEPNRSYHSKSSSKIIQL